jgi:hypothetical protein
MKKIIKKIFIESNDSIPFGYILLLTIMGYFLNQINSIIQYESSIPTLEYYFSEQKNDNSTEYPTFRIYCTLTNLSKDKALRNIELKLKYPEKYHNNIFLNNPKIIPISPSNLLSDEKSENIDKDLNIYRFPIIHPETGYLLKSEVSFRGIKHFYPKIYLGETDDNVRIIEYGWFTFLLKHQLGINIIIFIIIFILTWVILKIVNHQNDDNE